MQVPATIDTVPTGVRPVPDDLRLNIPGKTSRERHTVAQPLLLSSLFVAPTCLEQPERVGRLLQLWSSAFRAGDAAQLILPVRRGPDHIDRAIAVVQDAAAASGVDLDVLADIVLTTVPGDAPEDVAGVASARACWIALDGEDVPGGSGFTPVAARPDALHAAARQLAPYAFGSHSPAGTADGAA